MSDDPITDARRSRPGSNGSPDDSGQGGVTPPSPGSPSPGLSRVRAFSDETLADLKLALTEACSHSVRDAYGNGEGHVDISFELRDDRLIVEVAMHGSGFEHDPESSGTATRS